MAAAPHVYTAGELEALWINAGGQPDLAIPMAAIALAESGGNPNAHNASGATGLWQILGNPFPGNAYDPATNAKMAVSKFKSQGPSAWAAYTNGNYKSFLQQANDAFHKTFHGLQIPSQAAVDSALQGIPGVGGVLAGSQAAGALNLPNPLSGIEQIAAVLANVATFLTTPANWLRILEFVAGAVAVFYALMQLSGANKQVTQLVTTAATKVR
jgi:hypothetical protein